MVENVLSIIKYFPQRLKNVLFKMDDGVLREIQEIRFKIQCPILIYFNSKLYSVSASGNLCDLKNGIYIFKEDIEFIYNCLTGESYYAYADEISNCFITAEGGHRVGISGSAVVKNGEICGLKEINGVYFRIAHQIKDSANEILKLIVDNGVILNTVIAAPPGRGKTTVLREVSRNISLSGKKVSVIDERREVAAQMNGLSAFDIGYCDVLDGFPKTKGIERAIRALSPQVIVFDEIGNESEADIIASTMNCGVSFITTIHAGSMAELIRRSIIKKLIDRECIDILLVCDFGKIRDYKFLKGNSYDKNCSFELDLHNMRFSGDI